MEIRISTKAAKQLKKAPRHIRVKFGVWCILVRDEGLRGARKYKGYHDEPLQGKRWGQRSIRLSRSYRAIYVEIEKGQFAVIEIIEVNKHEY